METLRKVKYALLSTMLLFLVGCPPFPVIILSPSNGDHFEQGQEITFSGSAQDFLEGELTGDALVWTSSIDDEIGTGTSFSMGDLSKGTHIITLTATNAQDEKGTATITITIGETVPTTSTTAPPTTTTTAMSTTTSTVSPQPGTGKIILSTDSENDLLFYVNQAESYRLYYHGFETEGNLALTHVADGEGTIVIFSEDLIPIQWIAPDLTIVVYKEDDGTPFDPHNAYHEVAYGDTQDSFTIDIYPENLSQIITQMEASTGQQFANASQFLTTYSISSFADLVTRAKQSGQDQARFIAAAAGFSAAAAYLSMEAQEAGLVSAPDREFLQAPYGELIKFVVGMLAAKFNEEFGPSGPTDPDIPTVEVLLCRGVAQYGICHYMFFLKQDLGKCVSLCLTSMRCFTDICMPDEVSAETALECREHYLGEGG